MKYFILLTIFLPLNLLSQAETSDPEATMVLDRISETINKHNTLEIKFDLLVKNPEIEVEKQTGSMYQKGDMFYVDIAQQIIINNGKDLYIIFKEDNSAQLNSVDGNSESLDIFNPKSFLNIYKSDDYIYGITGEEDFDDKRLLSIEFKPKDRYSEYSKIRLGVDETKNIPCYIKIFNKDGSTISLVMREFVVDAKIKDDQFIFDKNAFPGIEVEDLRID